MPIDYAPIVQTLASPDMPFRSDLGMLWAAVVVDALRQEGIGASVASRPLSYWNVEAGCRRCLSVSAILIEDTVVPIDDQEEWKGWVLRHFNGRLPPQVRWESVDAGFAVPALSGSMDLLALFSSSSHASALKVHAAKEWAKLHCQAALLDASTTKAQSISPRRSL